MERWIEAVSQEVRQRTGGGYQGVVTRKACSGGCIHSAEIWQFTSGECFFIKLNRADHIEMFRQEAYALNVLRDTNTIRIPQLYALVHSQELDRSALVLEAIRSHLPEPRHWMRFGQQLAQLHRLTQGAPFGWNEDNFLGTTRQKNGWSNSWHNFFAEHRIRFQLQLLQSQEKISANLLQRFELFVEKLPSLLASGGTAVPSLLHGDLWSGNVLFDEAGRAVLIDPASYYGDREAEWGMIELFGGFPDSFREAYQAVYPLPEGWQVRNRIYRLYHLLNHWNLFGGSYQSACQRLLQEMGY